MRPILPLHQFPLPVSLQSWSTCFVILCRTGCVPVTPTQIAVSHTCSPCGGTSQLHIMVFEWKTRFNLLLPCSVNREIMACFFGFDRIISHRAYYCEKRIILCLSDHPRVLTKTFVFKLCCFFFPLLGWRYKGWGGALPGRNRLCQRRLVRCGTGRTARKEWWSSSRHKVLETYRMPVFCWEVLQDNTVLSLWNPLSPWSLLPFGLYKRFFFKRASIDALSGDCSSHAESCL